MKRIHARRCRFPDDVDIPVEERLPQTCEGSTCHGRGTAIITANGLKLCGVCFKMVSARRVEAIERNKFGRVYRVERPHKRRKRPEKLSKWAFLTKKAGEFRKRPTGAEAIFGRKLQELGIEFTFQYPFLFKGLGGIADFYLPEYELIVEIDGGYHLNTDQKCTDDVKDFIYKSKLKKNVLRLTNNQAIYLSIEQIGVLIENT